MTLAPDLSEYYSEGFELPSTWVKREHTQVTPKGGGPRQPWGRKEYHRNKCLLES